MMLEAVKSAQRQFPTRIFYKQEAAALIKIGDKGKHILWLIYYDSRVVYYESNPGSKIVFSYSRR